MPEDLLRKLYRLRNEGRSEDAAALFADDCVYHDQAWPKTLRGRTAVRDFFAESAATVRDLAFEVTSAFQSEDRFAGEVRMSGVMDSAFDLPYAIIGDRFGDGITRFVEYYNASDFGADGPLPPVRKPRSAPGAPRSAERSVAVVGAGTLGARIALMFAAGGSDVRIVNRSLERAEAAKRFADEGAATVRAELALPASRSGAISVTNSVAEGVPGAWLVIETVSEDLALKTQVLGELDRLADPDAVLATNSSSYPSSEMLAEVQHPERVMNMHFLMPPDLNVVELMSCGETDPQLIARLLEALPHFGLLPFEVRKESIGFIFNRVWAAIKRETLMAVEEGVTTPEEFDEIWMATIGKPPGPFRLMDRVGLDVVLAIEERYAAIREGIPDGPRDLLRRMADRGALGVKTGRGFYDDYDAG